MVLVINSLCDIPTTDYELFSHEKLFTAYKKNDSIFNFEENDAFDSDSLENIL